jgi:hypothetical protein
MSSISHAWLRHYRWRGTTPPYLQKPIRLKSTEDQRPSCARDLECRARRVKHNITLPPTFGCNGLFAPEPYLVTKARCYPGSPSITHSAPLGTTCPHDSCAVLPPDLKVCPGCTRTKRTPWATHFNCLLRRRRPGLPELAREGISAESVPAACSLDQVST